MSPVKGIRLPGAKALQQYAAYITASMPGSYNMHGWWGGRIELSSYALVLVMDATNPAWNLLQHHVQNDQYTSTPNDYVNASCV
jgi:hypothetical protein